MGDAPFQVVSGDTFPTKLHKLLSYAEKTGLEHIISWLPGSNNFKVHNKELFVAEVMPNFFSSSDYKTFQRNLNLWGFRTVSKGVRKGQCSHEQFVRNDIERCRRMVRVRIKSEGLPGDQDVTEEPSSSTLVGSALDLAGSSNQQMTEPRHIPGGNFHGMIQQAQQTQRAQQSAGFNFSPSSNAVTYGGNINNAAMRNAWPDPYLTTLASLVQNSSSNSINPISALQNKLLYNTGHSAIQSLPQTSLVQQLLQRQGRQTQTQPTPPGGPINHQLLAMLASHQTKGIVGIDETQNRILDSHEVGVNPSRVNFGSAFLALSQAQQSQQQPHVRLTPGGSPMSSTVVDSVMSPYEKRNVAGDTPLVGPQSKKDDEHRPSRSKLPLRETASKGNSRVIACRARGMPMDHNMHTAFFEIPKDAEHGMELVCSFPACRNGGVKFIYCGYCKDAIARRNFRTSHTHKDSCIEAQSRLMESSTSIPVTALPTNREEVEPSTKHPKKRMKQSKPSDDDSSGVLPSAASASSGTAKVATESPSSGMDKQNAGSMSRKPRYDVSRVEELKAQWIQLLEDRRKMKSNNDDDETTWLNRVMAVSNEFVDLSSAEESPATEESIPKST